MVLLVDGGDATNGGQPAGHPWFGSPMKTTTHYTFELMEHKNGAGAALEFWYPVATGCVLLSCIAVYPQEHRLHRKAIVRRHYAY